MESSVTVKDDKTLSLAYTEGLQARIVGEIIPNNPYSIGTPQYQEWKTAWENADFYILNHWG